MDKPVEKMDLGEMTQWAKGRLLAGIREDDFHDSLVLVIERVLRIGFERGKAEKEKK